MKFACAGCHAQYMISDEKVLPRGVKVRCKKCNHVNIVRRPAPATDPGEVARPAAEPRPAASLEDELGAAFDQVTGSTPGPDRDATDDFSFDPGAAPAAGGFDDLERTRIVEDPELQRIFAARDETPAPAAAPVQAAAPAAATVEWYLAIDDEQVGPLSFDEVRARWEAASIGPDTLCWRNGMADWTPLSQVPELADALAPLPAPPAASATTDSSWLEAAMKPQEPAAPSWTPSAASALKDLVEAELEASRTAEKPAEATLERDLPAAESTSVRSLLKELPKADAPAPEMSRLLPLAGLPEGAAPARPAAPVAAAEKKGGAKWIAVAAALVVLAGGGAFAAGLLDRFLPAAPAPVAAAPAPTPAPVSAPAAQQQPPAPAAAEAPPAEAGAVAAAPAAGGSGGEEANRGAGGAQPSMAAAQPATGGAGAESDPAAETAEKVAAEAEKKAQALAQAKDREAEKTVVRQPSRRRASRVERREPPPPPQPRPASTSSSSSGDLLAAAGSTNAIDSLFEQEFKAQPKSAPRRSGGGYIPPAPGSGGKPHQLSQGDIAGVVVGHKAALKNCATSYKAKSGQDSGTVVMRWTIRPDGSTTGVRPVKGAEHKELADCIGGLVRGWKFPAYSGPQMAPIDFPFQF